MQARLWTIAAISLALAVAGCTNGRDALVSAPLARDIGAPPPDLTEVQVAPPRDGENVFVVADRERNGRKRANYHVCELRAEWTRTRIEHLAGTSDVDMPAPCVPPSESTPSVPAKRHGLRRMAAP